MKEGLLKRKHSRKTFFKSQMWLNGEDSPSTGSIVCYDGDVDYGDGPEPCVFVEIADCHQKVRLHMGCTDDFDDFLDKLIRMNVEIGKFIEYLRVRSPHNQLISK
jgi:hypothetical protein